MVEQKAVSNGSVYDRSRDDIFGSGLFSEALPMQEFLEQVFDRKVELRCYQDNAAVIQIVEAGYSPKLKHMNKTFRINLGSIYECFKEDEMMKLLYIKQHPKGWPIYEATTSC